MFRRMRGFRLGLVACLFATALLSAGCTPGALAYLMLMTNPNYPPDEYTFTEKKSNPKVVILVSQSNVINNTDLFGADQLLAQRLTHMLMKTYQENREHVEIVPPAQVADFKNKNREDWQTMSPEEIAKHFKADFVVNLEITRLSMYESQQLYRGHAEVQVSVVDLSKLAEGPWTKAYKCEYPGSGPRPVDWCSPEVFRQQFFDKMSRELSRWFAGYPTDKKYDFD